eukprot:587774-Amphidinium_carterae.1
MTTCRIIAKQLANKKVKLQSSDVTLRFAWVVVALLGPTLPVLSALVALLSKIYFVLFFGSDSEVLDMMSE